MKYYIANWKMNMKEEQVKTWLAEFSGKNVGNVIIAASFPHLQLVWEAGFKTAAQDVSVLDKGTHTGEVGAFQLKDYCEYCIVGHSERKETSEVVKEKRDQCLKEGITPIVCFVNIESALDLYLPGTIMAWEDPQNISVNGQYNPKDANEIRTSIKILQATLPQGAEIVYGGSVNRQNIKDLVNIEGLNVVLVGNASLDPAHFYEISRS